MQVQQHVIDVITHIASTTSKFPKKCVVLCILGQFYFYNMVGLHWTISYLFFPFSFVSPPLCITANLFSKETVVASQESAQVDSFFLVMLICISCFYTWIGYALLTGICERVADIKTRAHAMKCLTCFSEAVGPGFVFERVSIFCSYIHQFSCYIYRFLNNEWVHGAYHWSMDLGSDIRFCF